MTSYLVLDVDLCTVLDQTPGGLQVSAGDGVMKRRSTMLRIAQK
jgi:hypothetical protein